ncbi:DUF4294 domain-containing protein [Prolixibacteraceae bacterium Z1-6]|uniref:DUF4294 domain-containing protein n=1 Tax=Draconibacterium aestuarii TaxID=2998507 RepID=A0A9X3F9L1_9BACT|nr:DUF4294 domain-containing protein [Prolixibacteraceae bacterium Z1-6]
MKRLIFILFLSTAFVISKAQERDTSKEFMGYVEDGDTIIFKNIKEVVVFPQREFKNKRQYRRYSRYVQKVKKVYPVAVEARELLEEYEPQYYALESNKERRRMMKQVEKELLDKHKEELKKWSISDGRILLKLINRETERTPYSLIQDFRGDVSALFWQGIARLFKNNLKDGYEPDDEDKMLEEIVTLIELGYL